MIRLDVELSLDDVSKLPKTAGVYEIVRNDGSPLKVGISKNLRSRLRLHRDSKQSRLKLKLGGSFENPADVVSKGSILAKHLFFDRSLSNAYDLTVESGRQSFLLKGCAVFYTETESRDVARRIEIEMEKIGNYRYCGIVRKR